MPHRRQIILPLVLVAFLAACGGSDSPVGPGNDNNDNGGGGTRTVKQNPSFSQDINEIFQRRGCSAGNCHGGGAGGMTLTSNAGTNYTNIVNVPAASENGFNRITPNDATNSYMVIKLEGRQSVGSRMPLGGTPLDNIDLTNLKNWINTGAPNN
jgi:hypothetical protein